MSIHDEIPYYLDNQRIQQNPVRCAKDIIFKSIPLFHDMPGEGMRLPIPVMVNHTGIAECALSLGLSIFSWSHNFKNLYCTIA